MSEIKISIAAIGALLLAAIIYGSFYVVEPGHRGILVTLGTVAPAAAGEGVGFKLPFITTVKQVSVRQQTKEMKADCYSSDLQQINVELRVLYRLPEGSVIRVFKDYAGDPFESLIYPRVSEALKEVTAEQSAETIVKKREEIKTRVLASAKGKIGDILFIEDIVIQDVALSNELESAIESKMVQEQEAAKAKFTQQKAQIEADTAVVRAKGEAEAIRVRGEALERSPGLVQLQIVEKWNGVSPLVVGGGAGQGANILLPIEGGGARAGK